MTSSIESNWVTELYTLQCLGEENTLPNVILVLQYINEEVLTLNWSDSTDRQLD